jgi:hypothetical protein
LFAKVILKMVAESRHGFVWWKMPRCGSPPEAAKVLFAHRFDNFKRITYRQTSRHVAISGHRWWCVGLTRFPFLE